MSDIGSTDFIFPSGNVLVSTRHPETGVLIMVPVATRGEAEHYIDIAFRILNTVQEKEQTQ